MHASPLPSIYKVLLLTVTILAATIAPAQAQKCGMAFAHQNSKQKTVLHPAAALRFRNCDAREYYDSVYTRETEHFQIFYTLDIGPHATRPEFVDSLAATLENALTFHTKTMGMRAPQGLDTTSHYQMPVKIGLYPVEIAEIDFLRDPVSVLKADACNGCYGVTYPSPKDYHKSEIIIDNDFKYVPENATATSSIERGEKTCTYPISTVEQNSTAHQYSYNKEFAKGIQVTIYHEMFHAVQLQYMDLFNHWTYWIEASAAGNEEVGAPDIDDYFLYVSRFFNYGGTAIDEIEYEYGLVILYLYLYNHVDKHFDKEIWELFETKPNAPFKENLKKILEKRGLDGDSLFHDFATAAALSGKNANAVSNAHWIHEDQPRWAPATAKRSTFIDGSEGQDKFTPGIPLYSLDFYLGGTPDLDEYKGKATALVFNGEKIGIREIKNTASVDSIIKDAFFADSIMWVFSSFDDPKRIPEMVKDSTLRAFPMPWRGNGSLCFTPLPESKKFIEIRNARGDLVLREPYERTTHCIDADNVKSSMKPGVYRFRAGSRGKTEKFIVTY